MPPLTEEKTKLALERRAEHLAEKFRLSLQLTTILVREHPEEAQMPISPRNLKALIAWARP